MRSIQAYRAIVARIGGAWANPPQLLPTSLRPLGRLEKNAWSPRAQNPRADRVPAPRRLALHFATAVALLAGSAAYAQTCQELGTRMPTSPPATTGNLSSTTTPLQGWTSATWQNYSLTTPDATNHGAQLWFDGTGTLPINLGFVTTTAVNNPVKVSGGAVLTFSLAWNNGQYGTYVSGANANAHLIYDGNQVRLEMLYNGVVYATMLTAPVDGRGNTNPANANVYANWGPTNSSLTANNSAVFTNSPPASPPPSYVGGRGAALWTTPVVNWTPISVRLPDNVPQTGAIQFRATRLESAMLAPDVDRTDDIYIKDVAINDTSVCIVKSTPLGSGGTFNFSATNVDYDSGVAGVQTAPAFPITTTGPTAVARDGDSAVAGTQPLLFTSNTSGTGTPTGNLVTIQESTLPAGYALRSVACDRGVSGSIAASTVALTALPAGVMTTCTLTNSLPQLSVTKSATPSPFIVGQPASYTITVSNAGPMPASGSITITDALPTGITLASFAGANWGCAGSPVSCVFTGTLGVGASTTVSLNVNVGPSATNGNNSATISSSDDNTCPAAARCTGSTTVAVTPVADVAISKTDGSTTYAPGAPITYTIVASNAGPSAVSGASVTDTIPAAISGAAWTVVYAGGGGGPAGGSGNIAASVNLPAGATATFTVTGTISAGATGNLVNTANIAAPAGTTDPVPGNNSATDTDTRSPQANLAISKTDGTTAYTPGGTTTYTIVVGNAGPSSADGALFTDPASSNLTATAVTCGAATGGAVCPAPGNTTVALMQGAGIVIPTLPNGGSVTFTVNATIAAAATGNITNTATIAPPSGTTDPTPGNNSASDVDGGLPQINVAKTATPNPFVVGQPASYTITLTNVGSASTTGTITIADTLPAGVTLANSSGTNWNACSGTTTLSCTFTGTLAAGASTTLSLNVDVAATAADADNTATASGGGDPTCPGAAHCSGSVTVPVDAAADIAVSKTVSNATPNVGDSVTFTITATNNGPSDATGVAITDSLPSGLAFVSATPSQGTYTQASGLWTIGALANAADATLQITATVLMPGALTNTATKTAGNEFDPNTGNNAGSAVANAQPSADLQVTKTVSNATPSLGTDVTFTITVHNAGPNDATGVVIDDALPAGLTFVSSAPSQGSYDSSTGV